MKKKFYIICIILGVFTFSFINKLFAQETKLVTVESMVVDEEGLPIANVEIFSDKAFTKTDANGKFSILVEPDSRIIFEKKGFEQVSFTIGEIRNMIKVPLKRVSYLYDKDAKIQLAFRQSFKGDVVGAVSKINTDEIVLYDNTIFADDILNGRTLGMLGSNNIRGIGIRFNVADITGSGLNTGNALFVVDGLPRAIEGLRLSEIESISILKDPNSCVLYGSSAINGVIMITTKRGEAFKSKSDFTVNYGISTPRALPKYLNSSDFMTYYNLARVNDGLPEQYDVTTIQNFRTGNKYRYPDIDYYSDEYLRPFKSYFDLMGEFSGGNNVAKYYSNFGWYSAGGILDFGEAANARNNIFNVRGNVDLRINNWINTSIDGTAIFGNNKNMRGNYWSAAANNRPHEFTPLIPFDLIDPENPLLKGRKNDIDGKYLLGGNVTYQTNAIADSYSAGVLETILRKFSFNNRINFDLGKVTRGLSFHTNVSFDYYTSYNQTIENTYSVYEPVWDAVKDSIVSLKQYGVDSRPGTQVVGNITFYRRFGFYGLLSYDRIFNNDHHLTGSLLGYGSTYKEQGDFQGVKHANLGMQISYIYRNKYMIDFSGALVNSVKLPENNRIGFSPSIGFAWMLSEENFLSSIEGIDFLKLRASAGILNSDIPIGGFFYYDDRYTTSGSYSWNEGLRSRSGVMSLGEANPDLGYSKRKSVNAGIEGMFLNKFLGAELNLFHENYTDLVTRVTSNYPGFFSDYIQYENFEAEVYKGLEFGLNINKSLGDWDFFLGANILYVTSERTVVNEIYGYDYLYRKGKPVDATFGLEAIGLFKDQADIDNSPLQTFGTVKPGDIKYKDQNNDGAIDANDEVYIRRYQAPFSGGLQIKVSYRNLTLYVLGEGRSGADSFKEGNYYWVDGNKKYSEVVLNSWTPATANTATYPRLSTFTNNNNHRRSTYWLYNNDYFQVRKIQLTYKLPDNASKFLKMRRLDLFVNASDVFQFAKNRKLRDLSTGNEPYYRTFSAGMKAQF